MHENKRKGWSCRSRVQRQRWGWTDRKIRRKVKKKKKKEQFQLGSDSEAKMG